MPKGPMLDRLAGAMKTLGKREGKALTPRQRVAAAQRWNSLADIGEDELKGLNYEYDHDKRVPSYASRANEVYKELDELRNGLRDIGLVENNGFGREFLKATNPFLSDNIDKYAEQSDFLDWCRYNRVEPNARSLKQFRWETYKTLPYRERQWIANKDGILESVGPEDPAEFRNARTLRDWDAASEEYMGSEWDMQDLSTYNSYEEFPDDFDYMWRY